MRLRGSATQPLALPPDPRAGDLYRTPDKHVAEVDALLEDRTAGIPYEWHRRNQIARYEGYYASVFYSYFAALGLEVRVEESGSHGRLDMAVRTGGVYLFEFKVVERAGSGAALAQLRARGYVGKYRHLGELVYLVGVEFSEQARNLARFGAERA